MVHNLIEKLKNGETVQFRAHGNSMTPILKSGQKMTVAPLADIDEIRVGDPVYCKVGGRVFLHKVTAIRGVQYQISNNHGHVNGWITRKNIFGKLIGVED